MSRLRRLVLSDRYFFVTCNLRHTRALLQEPDFRMLARVIDARRRAHGFFLTAWVLLPDHWHAIIGPPVPLTISGVMESVKVSSTRQINTQRKESGRLWRGRFFDRALRTVKEYGETVDHIHHNPVRRDLVKHPGEWMWSSYAEYATAGEELQRQTILMIDKVRLPADGRTRI